jgi:rubrerythrin
MIDRNNKKRFVFLSLKNRKGNIDRRRNMTKKWDGAEFFRLMAANEQAVGDWYRTLANDAKFGGKFFEKMAKDEDRHYQIYTALLKKYEGTQALTVEVSEDHEAYLNALMKDHIESDADNLKAKAAKASTKDDIYAIAEQVERDSVLFVEELIELYPDLKEEDFKVVLQEEKNHLAMVLTRRMDSQLNTLRL